MTWRGYLGVGPGRLVYAGALSCAHRHSHIATQVLIVDSGLVRLTDDDGRSARTSAAVIPARIPHTIEAVDGTIGLLVYLDPATRIGAAIVRVAGAQTTAEGWVRAAEPLRDKATAADRSPVERADQITSVLLGDTGEQYVRRHPVVDAAVAVIAETIPEPVRLPDIAARVAISASRLSRLSRLFADQLGLSVPAYVRWLRIQRAIEALRDGASLTDAAHAAGFTDSAHANRVCHEMFGIAPSQASGELRWS